MSSSEHNRAYGKSKFEVLPAGIWGARVRLCASDAVLRVWPNLLQCLAVLRNIEALQLMLARYP
jgi:hypothetical protein